METQNGTPPTFVTINKDELQKMFIEAKTSDLTQSQFEHEKTKRIQALCEALKHADAGVVAANYGHKSEREEIMSRLLQTVDSFYVFNTLIP